MCVTVVAVGDVTASASATVDALEVDLRFVEKDEEGEDDKDEEVALLCM